MMMMLKALFMGFAACIFFTSEAVTRRRVVQKNTILCLIPGAMEDAQKAYTPMMDRVKNMWEAESSTRGLKFAAVVADFMFNMPDPLTIDSVIQDAVEKVMKEESFLLSDTEIFLAGHSLGGVVLQDYLHDLGNFSNPDVHNGDNLSSWKSRIRGQILMGSGIQRKYRRGLDDVSGKSLEIDMPYPTLTIQGELDGLYRVLRGAEGYYHQVANSNHSPSSSPRNPIYVVPGLSHQQFAAGVSAKDAPWNVRRNDLPAEISDNQAIQEVAHRVLTWMKSLTLGLLDLKIRGGDHVRYLQEAEDFFRPLVKALELEGSTHLKPPCWNQALINDPSLMNCSHGSPVVHLAQKVIGYGNQTTNNFTLQVDDNFHRVWTANPVHLPTVLNECNIKKTSPSGTRSEKGFDSNGRQKKLEESCKLRVVTVSETRYLTLDDDYLDTGLWSTAAEEIKAKLVSRQRVLQHAAGQPDNGFIPVGPEVNEETTCADANRLIYNNVIEEIISVKSRERFLSKGVQLQMGIDLGPFNAGPLWIWRYLEWEKVTEETNKMKIHAPYLSTPVDYPIAAAAGFHYCKLLSPAKIADWVYTDGLRPMTSEDGHQTFLAKL